MDAAPSPDSGSGLVSVRVPPVVAARPLRPLFVAGGFVALALGVAGVVLPLVPTTPFLLVSAYCFARGSPRLHGWLVGHRLWGPFLSRWWSHRAVPRRAKWLAIAVVWASLGASMIWATTLVWVRGMLLVLLLAVTFYLVRLPSYQGAPATTLAAVSPPR